MNPEPQERDAPPSLVCFVCHFLTEVDDIELITQRGVLCCRCVHRLAEDELRIDPKLRRELQQIVNGTP